MYLIENFIKLNQQQTATTNTNKECENKTESKIKKHLNIL